MFSLVLLVIVAIDGRLDAKNTQKYMPPSNPHTTHPPGGGGSGVVERERERERERRSVALHRDLLLRVVVLESLY